MFKSGVWVLCGGLLVGCGPAMYTVSIVPASREVQRAQEVGAAEHAPYEYYYALEFLNRARHEVGEAEYQNARRYANIAREYGKKARRRARERRRETTRNHTDEK